jgi:hypothetical protein
VSLLLSRRLRPLLLPAVLAGVVLGAVAPAWAQTLPVPQPRVPSPPRAHDPHQRGLSEAVRRAERAGQVLSAEHVQYDGRDVNRVKIVDDRGRVRVYWDDPAAQRDADGDDGKEPRDKQSHTRTRHDDDGDPTL